MFFLFLFFFFFNNSVRLVSHAFSSKGAERVSLTRHVESSGRSVLNEDQRQAMHRGATKPALCSAGKNIIPGASCHDSPRAVANTNPR